MTFAPDPNATGAPPTIPFPNAFSAQALPANTPPWSNSGNMVATNNALLMANFQYQMTNPYSAVYANDVCTRYVVNTPGAPGQNVTWTFNPGGAWDASPTGPYTVKIPAASSGEPTGFITGYNTDHEVAFWDQGNTVSAQFWGTYTTNGGGQGQIIPIIPPESNTGQIIATNDANYPGFGPGPITALSTSTAACGIPYLATLITWADFKAGAIKHMLFCTTGNPTGSPVNPAPFSDGVSSAPISSNGIPEGTIFVFPGTVSNPGRAAFVAAGSTAPDLAVMVFNAIQQYGMLVGDSSAAGGVGVAIESFQPWQDWNPSAFPSMKPPYWMWNNTANPWGEGAFLGMPWSSMVALEPGTLLSPLMSDNNAAAGTHPTAIQGVQVTAATTTITTSFTTATNDMVIVWAMLGPTGAVGNTLSGLGATWVKVYEQTETYAGDSSVRVAVCWVGYACASGDNTLATSFTAAGDVSISRWPRSVATNPIVASATVNSSGASGVQPNFPANAVSTTATTQIVVGLCAVGYTELTENAFGAITELNWGGTSWSNGKFNRHICNGINETNSVWQNWISPGAVGSVTVTHNANGYKGWGGWVTGAIVLAP